jgi:hypothetical protein
MLNPLGLGKVVRVCGVDPEKFKDLLLLRAPDLRLSWFMCNLVPSKKDISSRAIQICVTYRRGHFLRNGSLGDFVVVRTS